MLVVVNPRAARVSDRLRDGALSVLGRGFALEVAGTGAPGHATEIAAAAARSGFDFVLALGGDGTANEVANGLVGTETALALVPAGTNNVTCRMLGLPRDVAAAADRFVELARSAGTRRIDLGSVAGRYFLVASGIGFDAEGIAAANAHPRLKALGGNAWYGAALLGAFLKGCVRDPCVVRVEAGSGPSIEAAMALVQNADPLAFVAGRAMRGTPGEHLDSGTVSLLALRRLKLRDAPKLARRALSPAAHHDQIELREGLRSARIQAVSNAGEPPTPFPLHVDGNPIGRFTVAEYAAHPRALPVLA